MIEYGQITLFVIDELRRWDSNQALYEEEIEDWSCYKYQCLVELKQRLIQAL